jgi:DNA-directed RNA polymerase subunit N (RpoN/RPB10)
MEDLCMNIRIDEKLAGKINDASTIKAIATISKNGVPHIVYKGSIMANDDGNIVFYELIESSRNGQNLVYSIWFNKKVAINILDSEKNSYEIVGHPARCITCGHEFEEVYKKIREKLGDIDLSAIWIIEPEDIREETFSVRRQQDEERYPVIKHLDRLRA